jgi:hypothetical protein
VCLRAIQFLVVQGAGSKRKVCPLASHMHSSSKPASQAQWVPGSGPDSVGRGQLSSLCTMISAMVCCRQNSCWNLIGNAMALEAGGTFKK